MQLERDLCTSRVLWDSRFIVYHNIDTFDNGCEAVPPEGSIMPELLTRHEGCDRIAQWCGKVQENC